MARTGQIVLLVCIGLCIIQSASALKCYECIGCNDKFDSSAAGVTINNNCVGSCLKVKGDSQVVRSCSPVSLGGDKCESQTVQGIKGTACSCSSDLCNSASGVKISMATAFLAAFVAVLKQLF